MAEGEYYGSEKPKMVDVQTAKIHIEERLHVLLGEVGDTPENVAKYKKAADFASDYFDFVQAYSLNVDNGELEKLSDVVISEEERASETKQLVGALTRDMGGESGREGGYIHRLFDPDLDYDAVMNFLVNGLRHADNDLVERFPSPDKFLVECAYEVFGASLLAEEKESSGSLMESSRSLMVAISNENVSLNGRLYQRELPEQDRIKYERVKNRLLNVHGELFDDAVDLVGYADSGELNVDPNTQIAFAGLFYEYNLGKNDLEFLKKLYWMTKLSSEKYNELSVKKLGDRAEIQGDLRERLGGVKGIGRIDAEFTRWIVGFESGTERIAARATKLFQKFSKNSEKYFGGKAKNDFGEVKAKKGNRAEDYDDWRVNDAIDNLKDGDSNEEGEDYEPKRPQRSLLNRFLGKK